MIKTIFILGSTGMAGHMITRYLSTLKKYKVRNVSLEELNEETIILDVVDKDLLGNTLIKIKPDVVINCIGLLIKASAEQHALAIYLNSFLPHYLVELGTEMNFKTIHLSTDCVFSGKRGEYSENDVKDGEGHYARTKVLGEIINNKDLTFRTSFIGPELKISGTGLFHWFMNQKGTIYGYNNIFWTGLTTLELAKAIDKAIDQDLSSLYHLVPNKKISKFELLNLIKGIWGKPIEILKNDNPKSDKSLINNRNDFNYRIPDYRTM